MILGAGLVAASALSCGDKSPGGPSPTPTPTTPPAPTHTVKAVTIAGPASVAPGASAQFTAMLQLADGTEKAATSARWFSSLNVVLAVDANTGVATSRYADIWGEATLGVEALSLDGVGLIGQRTASREILVLPDGTFRIVGVVTDGDDPAAGIPDVLLEVRLSEDLSARTVTYTRTGSTGQYALYGVPAESYLHVRRGGYLPVTEHVRIAGHASRDFKLRVDGNVPSLVGTYTMTVDATNCTRFSQLLDPQYRLRTYTATIQQSGARLTVRLSDAQFGPGSDGFSGIVTLTGADMQLRSFYNPYYYPSYPPQPDVAERLGDGTYLETSGHARLTGTPDSLSGTTGMLRRWGTFQGGSFMGGCSEPRITLTRR